VTLFIGSGLAAAQTGQGATPASPSTPEAGEQMQMMMKMRGRMMAERQKMLAEMKAMDQRLDELVAKMTAAEGADKIDAVAAVVKELVAQRTILRGRAMGMQGRMMEQMKSMMKGAEQPSAAPDSPAPHQH
jgi:hypothetical protein